MTAPTNTPPQTIPIRLIQRKHPHALCEQCPLYDKGKHVPTQPATTPSRFAVVAESPGTQERLRGKPLVGPSGQLLDAILDDHGLPRDKVHATHATLCHYPPKMEDKYTNGPPRAAVAACRPRLLHELKELRADRVLLLGNASVASLGPNRPGGITTVRVGPEQQGKYGHTVIPTFHPAAILRNQGQFPLLHRDVGKFARTVTPEGWYDPEEVLLDEDLMPDPALRRQHWWNLLTAAADTTDGIVMDTESGQDKDEVDGGTTESQVLCIGVGMMDSPTAYVVSRDLMDSDPTIGQSLYDMLAEKGFIGQNAKYDNGVIMNHYNAPRIPEAADTMLRHYALYEESGIHGLKYMATEYLATPSYEDAVQNAAKKGKRSGRKDFAAVPKDILLKYNAWDVHATRLLELYLRPKIKSDSDMSQIFGHLMQASELIVSIEQAGMSWDDDKSREIEAEYSQHLKSDEEIGLNPRSPKQIAEYFQAREIYVPNTSKDSLEKVLEKHDDKIVEAILENRKYTKLVSTYVTGLRKKVVKGKIHPSYRIHGTNTGRLSSRNPNAQNIPGTSRIKEQFVVDSPNHRFISRDFSQAELRVLTYLAQDRQMQALFSDPERDVFDELSIGVYGQDEFNSWDPKTKKQGRRLIKTFAYGLSYGREVASIAAAFGISISEAEAHMAKFKAMLPDIMAFQKDVIARIHRGEDLVTPFGRHRRFHVISKANRRSVENEAMAFLPQSTASDICVLSAIRLRKEGVDIRNLIHDDIMTHVHVSEVDEVSALMRKIMVETGEEITEGYVPFDTDVTIGTSWADL